MILLPPVIANVTRPPRTSVTVDPFGNAEFYEQSYLRGWRVLGTVSTPKGTGALVRNVSTGVYAQANAGSLSSLPQREVIAALNKYPGHGE